MAQNLPFPMDLDVPGTTAYSLDIPVPESIIGHQIGTRHTMPYQVYDYFRAVAAASDRVILREHGRTYEGRPLIHAIVTSPRNHQHLDEILAANERLSESPDEVSDGDLEKMPVILYQGYSIHGNEASGTEAAILYLYHLAAGSGPAVEDALEKAVVILDPMYNPDGRARFTGWVNRNRGAVPVSDPQDREHNEAWPFGRTNHYWFDLNRDWLPAQHPESRGRLGLFHAWRPQILTDHHEMGSNSTFFFQPGIPSRNNPITPENTYELTAKIAEYHARGLDRIGSSYYSKESFDDYYLGKGSAYPDVNGSVGILFEQASSRALVRDVQDGELRYAFTVMNHFIASVTTLEAGAALRMELLDNQREFYSSAPSFARNSHTKAWLISEERGATRVRLLTELLARHRVVSYELSKKLIVDGRSFRPGRAVVIPIDQPQARLLKAVMQRTTSFRDSLFYDVSTWTLPLAYDVDYSEYAGSMDGVLGKPVSSETIDPGQVVGGEASFAYLLPWNRFYSARALYRILDAGFHPRVAEKPFKIETGGIVHSFGRGTVIIPVTERAVPDTPPEQESLHYLVRRIASEDQVRFFSVSTGSTSEGPDLGGASTHILALPRIALVTGPGISSYAAGEAWHLLSERMNIPVSLIDSGAIPRLDLSKYSVVTVPGGSLNDPATAALKAWNQSGGELIVLSGAARWAVSNELFALESKPFDLDSLSKDLSFDQLDTERGAQQIGGSIFALKLDTTHPLGWGMPGVLPVFHSGNTFYESSGTPGTVVGTYDEPGLLSGYISSEKAEQLPGSTGVVAIRNGRGRSILFLDRVNFRAFWLGSERLFLNAVFFGSAF